MRTRWNICLGILALASRTFASPQETQSAAPPARVASERGPVLIEFHAVSYPPQALSSGREAEIPCELDIDEAGAVASVRCEVVEEPAVVDAVAEELAKARFVPAQRKGRPVPSRFRFVYRFSLQRQNLPEPSPFAAAGTVRGEVLVGGARTGIAGAEVIAQGLAVATTADGKGRFSLDLPPGAHVLIAAAPLFARGEERVEVRARQTSAVTFYLRQTGVPDLSATVIGERNKFSASRSTLVEEELRNVPGSDSDPVRVVENLPGIARAPFTGGQLIVRGARASDTAAYVDGQRIPILYHLLEGPSVLSEPMVERIDFYPGGAGVFFGRHLAGTVAVASKRGDPDRLHGILAADLNKSFAFLQGPLSERTQFAVAGRRSYVNPVVRLMANSNKEITLPVYWDYQARLDHRASADDRLTLFVYGSGDSFETIGGGRGSVPLAQGREISFHRARLAWDRRVTDRLSFTIAPAFGFDSSKSAESGAGAGIFARPQSARERTLSLGLRADGALRASDGAEARAGLDLFADRFSYESDRLYDQQLRSIGAPNAVERQIAGARIVSGAGVHAETELRQGAWRITPGLRVELLGYAGRIYPLFEPRLWGRYAVDAATTAFAYAGLYHQAPRAEELDPLVGNPGLRPLRAEQYGVGVERRFGSVWTVRAEGFFNRRSSLVFPAEPTALPDGTFENPLQRNSGQGHSIGLEVLLRRELTARFYGWIAYTLSRSRDLPAPSESWRPTPFDQPQILTLLLGFRPSPYVELSGRVRYASGNPIAPATSSTFDADSGNFIARRLPFGSKRLPAFVQIDFEINNIWAGDLTRFALYVDFQNVLGRRNAEALIYDFRFREEDFVHGVPFNASVGARLSF